MMAGPANYDVRIVGLGYVGLTLATVLAEAGNTVIGGEATRSGRDDQPGHPALHRNPASRTLGGRDEVQKLVAAERFDNSFFCDTYIITVGTPLSARGVAQLDIIEHAARDIAENMRDGALVILRSTVKVGRLRDVGCHRSWPRGG